MYNLLIKPIFTHDRGFFYLIHRKTDDEDWVYFDFNKDEKDNTSPKIKDNLTALQKAVQNFDENNFESCGNNLRQEAETILTQYLDPNMKKLQGEFESLGDKLDKAFNTVKSRRLQNFKQRFFVRIANRQIKGDYANDESLSMQEKSTLDITKNHLLNFFLAFNEESNKKELLIDETKDVLDRILNSAFHHSDNPLHRAEMKDAIDKVTLLKELLV